MLVTDRGDLPEILALQKEAFFSEAVKYDDFEIPPMVQTLEDLLLEFDNGTRFFKQLSPEGVLIGSVRGQLVETRCQIGRLVVKPNFRRQGVARMLLSELELYFSDQCDTFNLFTGDKSDAALGLYKLAGYAIQGRETAGEYYLVHLSKPSRHSSSREK